MITQNSSACPDAKTWRCAGGDKPVNCQWSTRTGRSCAEDPQQTNSEKIKCEAYEVLLYIKIRISDSPRVMSPDKAANKNEWLQ